MEYSGAFAPASRSEPDRTLRRFSARAQSHEKLSVYKECVGDLIQNENVLLMDNFIQHGDVTCLEHCILVSYSSYLICRLIRLDYRSAARGGLLHDLFLYDWHVKNDIKGLHAFSHPNTALDNANLFFTLNLREQDIIKKHMWPLTLMPPMYPESLIVSVVDKYFAISEFIKFHAVRLKK